MNSHQTTASELAAVADAIRSHERFVITTHENPDGDALGSLLATKLALDQLGKDAVMVLVGDAPLPGEYAFMELAELQRRWPEDVAERVLLAVDCANESRIADPEVLGRVPLSVDIDHHHDNTRFGRTNLIVADASSTGEVLRDVFRELDVELTPEIAEPLYIALVTDTGRFQYTNTTPKALRLAAELVEAGATSTASSRASTNRFSSQSSSCSRVRSSVPRCTKAAVSSSRTSSAPTSPRSGRPSRIPRGSSTTCVPSKARTWRC